MRQQIHANFWAFKYFSKILLLETVFGISNTTTVCVFKYNRKFQIQVDIVHELCQYKKTTVIALLCRVKISAVFFISSQSTLVTDRRTDRIAISYTALEQLLRAVKITAFALFGALRHFVKYFKKYLNTHFSGSI